MPRAKNNDTAIKLLKTSQHKTRQSKEPDDTNSNAEEPAEDEFSQSGSALSKFKFEKRPHIKIEFENDNSPVKEEPKGLWEPNNWKEFLLNLRNMRSNYDAPVDSMGCHKAMDENAPPEVMRYQSLIALMLSSQTKDQVTFAAMERLKARGLTVDNVLNMSDEELGKLIYPVGFWKTKVKYIKKTTQTLKDQYKGDIPDSADKLCKLTGVGPKMAHICMKVAWNKVTGIGVDTHVHRISNRIGWVKKPTATPEDTRKALQTWLPFDLWSEVNHLMVGFGQTICVPISPKCNECLNRDICPSSGIGRKSPKKSPSKLVIDEDIEGKPQKSPRKKITPSKELKVIQDIDASYEIDVKNEKNTVITKLDVNVEPEKVPRKRKVTPKNSDVKIEEDPEVNDFEAKINMLLNKVELQLKPETSKLIRKRKVTPKKDETVKNLDKQDIDDFEDKKEIVVTKTQKSSNKKEKQNNLSIKSKENTRNTTQLEDESVVIDKDNSKTLSMKRKSPRNKKADIVAEKTTMKCAKK